MAKNGIYTRGLISKSGYIYRIHAEIYDRHKKAVEETDLEYKGDFKIEEIQNRIKMSLSPGKALINTEITERIPVVFEMSKDAFYLNANCREVNKG